MLTITTPSEADCHAFVTCSGLVLIGAQQPIPPGNKGTKIGIQLGDNGRMMNPMNVGRDHNESDQAVQTCRHPDITVDNQCMHHAYRFVDEHGDDRWA
jgi:hypothetical protein